MGQLEEDKAKSGNGLMTDRFKTQQPVHVNMVVALRIDFLAKYGQLDMMKHDANDKHDKLMEIEF